MLVTGLMVLWMGGESMARQLAEMVASGFSFDHRLINDPGQIVRHISRLLGQAVSALLPMMAGPVLVAIASPMLLGGIVLSGKSLSPSFSKLNPLSGLKRMFSAQTAAELLKAVLKAVLVGSVAGWYVWSRWPDMLHLITESPGRPRTRHEYDRRLLLLVVLGPVPMVGFDVFWQLFSYFKSCV